MNSKKGKKHWKRSGLAAIATNRSKVPMVASGSQPSDLSRVRYSSLLTSDSSVEAESTGNESDTSETVIAAISTPLQTSEAAAKLLQSRKGSFEKQGVSIKTQNLKISKQTENEQWLMSLVTTGNVSEAREFISTMPQDKNEFYINKTNFDGFSVLHIAVRRQDEDMLKLLLSIEDINVYDTFFYAIKEGDVGMVKQFIDFEVESAPRPLGLFKKLPHRSEKDNLLQIQEALLRLEASKNLTFNSEFDDDMTPLMLAAQFGHFELIKLFFDTGERLPKITDLDCKTWKCMNQGELRMSEERLHIYQAISNPAYICFLALEFNSVDPILEAFNLIMDLKKVMSLEPEMKASYDELISNLQQFTGDLLGLCRDDTEVELLLKQKAGFQGNMREVYPRLILAVKTQQIEFVTHPHTQKVLYSEWIRGFESWATMGPIRRSLEFFWRTFFLVFISLWQCIQSSCWTCGKTCSRKMSSPVSRFVHSLGSYVIFLLLLILESNMQTLGDPFDPNDKAPPRSSVWRIIIEFAILIFAIGHVVSTMKQFCFMPRMFFHQLWNIYEVVNHIFFLLAYIFWFIAWLEAPAREQIIHGTIGGREYWIPHHPLLIGECFFSMALIMSFGQIFRVLRLNSKFGPLQIALGKMLKDMCRLIPPFLTVILSFAGGMCMLYKAYDAWIDKDEKGDISTQKQAYTSMLSAAETLFWGLYGMAGTDNLAILPVHYHHNDTLMTFENHHRMTEISGKVMYACYHVVATILLLNTIVAMLTGSAGEVFQNVDKEYKLGRTELWVFYGRDMKVPSPFNTIALLRNTTFLRCLGLASGGKDKKWKRGMSMDRCCYVDEVNPESDKKLRTAYSILVKELLERYFHAKATISLSQPAKLDQVNKVRETVGELRERFKVVLADVTGTTPSRKARTLGTVSSAVTKFKRGRKENQSEKGLIGTLQTVPRRGSTQ